MTRRTRLLPALLVAALLALLALLAPSTASAEPPGRLDEQVTDAAGVLSGSDVQTALEELRRDTGVQLFVVFVDTFDGLPAQQWADQTAIESDLGVDDYLMAVAVEDRAWAYSVDAAAEITDEQLQDVARDVESALAVDDWDGAVVAAASGYRAALTGNAPADEAPAAADDPDGGSAGSWIASALPWLLAGAGVLALGAVLVSRRRRSASAAGGSPAGPPQRSTEELEREANRLLVETDDAVRSSETELGFAVAEFGSERTAGFEQALTQARAALARGFAIRQQLDDDRPETDQERRALLTEIIEVTTRANDVLDAEAEAFDALRDLLADAPARLNAIERDAAQVESRVPTAEAELVELRLRYADSALQSVAHNVEEARARIEFARTAVADARTALQSTETRARAADGVQAAEQAVAQAGRLLDAVQRAGADLAEAVSRLPEALAELRADVREARGEHVPEQDVAAAEAALRQAEQTQAADPLGALHRVVEADAALERARGAHREETEARRRAEAHLQSALVAARAEIQAVEDFIATRRGAVQSPARTRLAQAQHQLSEAERVAPHDPQAALTAAQHADRLAEEAGRLARADVEDWYRRQGGGYGGGFGGGIAGGRSNSSGMLAGILLGQILGGGGLGGGSRAGGGFGGGFGGAGRRGGGGGFGGGMGGRRGGGGRF
ncbi:TPM domain-containing protein [Quadrisphaera sp. GCM10027208]|uniref:TPM domain-containing protein n=1 Tax=Quadrisphaera sp. GCM10027208 TaxID=3273423 RepID=UPI0036075CD9